MRAFLVVVLFVAAALLGQTLGHLATVSAQPPQPPTADQVATQLCAMGRTQDEKNAAAIIANNLKTIADLQAEVATLKAAAEKAKAPAK